MADTKEDFKFHKVICKILIRKKYPDHLILSIFSVAHKLHTFNYWLKCYRFILCAYTVGQKVNKTFHTTSLLNFCRYMRQIRLDFDWCLSLHYQF